MTNGRGRESGFALLLAILALVLLASLGLTLATQTSTELQIATNYRWGQQAYYNAELGLELAKNYLLDVDLAAVLPTARGVSPLPEPYGTERYNRTGMSGEPSRNFENEGCDTVGNEGFGAVLDIPTLAFPLQNMNVVNIGGNSFPVDINPVTPTLNGTFTVWIRRPLVVNAAAGGVIDDPGYMQAILTAEGTAPYALAGTGFTQSRRAVRYLDATIFKVLAGCGQGNQEGNTAEGTAAETCTFTNTGVNLVGGAN
jgi:hypothetical protein